MPAGTAIHDYILGVSGIPTDLKHGSPPLAEGTAVHATSTAAAGRDPNQRQPQEGAPPPPTPLASLYREGRKLHMLRGAA
jgi:hypothetical protein